MAKLVVPQAIGIENPDNLCYMISVIQQLYSWNEFRTFILDHDEYKTADNEIDGDSNSIHYCLKKMFMWMSEASLLQLSAVNVTPYLLPLARDFENNIVSSDVQQDASNFLCILFQTLLLETKQKYSYQDDERECHRMLLLQEIFQGELVNIINKSIEYDIDHNLKSVNNNKKKNSNSSNCVNPISTMNESSEEMRSEKFNFISLDVIPSSVSSSSSSSSMNDDDSDGTISDTEVISLDLESSLSQFTRTQTFSFSTPTSAINNTVLPVIQSPSVPIVFNDDNDDNMNDDQKQQEAHRLPPIQSHTIIQKTCKFNRLPHHLTFHLRRFTFDYNTMSPKKSNTYFPFPCHLNMKPYMHHQQQQVQGQESSQSISSSSSSLKSSIPRTATTIDSTAIMTDSTHLRTSDTTDGSITRSYEYKLSGVIVHQGTAQSGHFYSLIRKSAWGSTTSSHSESSSNGSSSSSSSSNNNNNGNSSSSSSSSSSIHSWNNSGDGATSSIRHDNSCYGSDDDDDVDVWVKVDDDEVTPFPIEKLASVAFGGGQDDDNDDDDDDSNDDDDDDDDDDQEEEEGDVDKDEVDLKENADDDDKCGDASHDRDKEQEEEDDDDEEEEEEDEDTSSNGSAFMLFYEKVYL